MNSQTNNQERTIDFSGLVTQSYCILASVSQTSKRSGTLWTAKDGGEYIVMSKNHHRVTDEQSLISISLNPMKPVDVEESTTTTAAGMFEVASMDDRYETINAIAYKEYSSTGASQWRSVVYGGAGGTAATIDPYVVLTNNEFFLAARVYDAIKDGSTHRVLDKTYTLEDDGRYRVIVRSEAKSLVGPVPFDRNDMFRTIVPGDIYVDNKGSWIVRGKNMFYMDSILGTDYYGRKLVVSANADL